MPLHLSPHRRVFAGFAIYSFAMGSIFPRIGAIQTQMGVEEGALGLGLTGAPVGCLAALSFAAPVIERIGFRRTLLGAIPLLALLYAIAVQAPSPVWLFVLLLPVGLMLGVIEVVLNTEADRVEAAAGRRIMNRAHAFWSVGIGLAAGFGAVMAWLGLTPQWHLALVVPITVSGVWLFLSGFTPAPHRARNHGKADAAPPRFAVPTGPILILVSVTLSAMLMEGASMDWSAIYLRDTFAAIPLEMALGVAAFAVAQALARYNADIFVTRYSPAGVARATILIMLAGCLTVSFPHTLGPTLGFAQGVDVVVAVPFGGGTVAFDPSLALSLIGFALMGVGSAALFPLAMSAAAQREDRSAAVNVASLAQISFTVFLLGPPLLGYVAEHFGIRAAFGIGLPLIALSFVTAGALGRKPV